IQNGVTFGQQVARQASAIRSRAFDTERLDRSEASGPVAIFSSASRRGGASISASRWRDSQRVNVERPMPRSSATSRLVRPPICASRTASCSNSFVKRNCFVLKASFYTKKTSPLLRTKLQLTNDRGVDN